MINRISSIRTSDRLAGEFNPGHVLIDKMQNQTVAASAIDAEIDDVTNQLHAAAAEGASAENLAYLRRFRAELQRRRDYALILRTEYASRYVG